MARTHRIAEAQNAPRTRTLLRAIAAGHQYAVRAQVAALIVSAMVAALSILTCALPVVTPIVVLVGAAWAVSML